ncbi:MAG TPA: sugar isomerase domain-containing protein [Roseiarcus sp.]|nr:sugar isomerase domain-containing protein [Roseiarcus sp.]
MRPQPNSRPPGSTTRRPGVARARPWAILRSHQLDPADSIVLFSHSGVNAVILDIALGAKEKGLTVIAVTSLPHSSASPARHSSGKRLFEVADIVIDTRASLSDASIRIEGLDAPVGANSTSVAIAIAHAIVAATAEKLVRRGIEPLVMVNPNTAGKEAANAANDRNYEELWRRLKAR